MKDKHLWKFRKISGNDLEIVLNSVFYNLRLKRQLFNKQRYKNSLTYGWISQE